MFKTIVYIDEPAAWRAAIAGFIAQFMLVGYHRSVSLLLLALHEDFDVPSELLLPTAIIGSSLEKMLAIGVERINHLCGTKFCLLLSTILAVACPLITSFVPLTGAVVVGLIGVGMGLASALPPVPCYNMSALALQKRRGLAFSVVKCGACAGAICFPPLFVLLCDEYGSRGALMILAGIFAHLLLSTVLIPSKVINRETGKEITQRGSCQCTSSCRKQKHTIAISDDDHEQDELCSEEKKTQSTRRMRSETKPLIVRLPLIIFYCSTIVMSILCFSQMSSVYPLFADELGISRYTIAALQSLQSGVDMAWRLVAGLINDRLSNRGRLLVMGIMVSLGSICTLVFGLSNGNLVIAVVYSVTTGISLGHMASGWVPVLVGFTDVTHLSRTMSLTLTSVGFCSLASVPLISLMMSKWNSYRLFYFLYGGGIVYIAISCLLISGIFSRCKRKSTENEVNISLSVRDE